MDSFATYTYSCRICLLNFHQLLYSLKTIGKCWQLYAYVVVWVAGGILVPGVISWRPRGTTTRSECWSLALIPPATQATCVANESTLCILVDGASNSLESWLPCIWLDKLWKLLHLHGLSGIRNMLSFLFYNLHCIYSLWSHLSWRSQLKNESSETGSGHVWWFNFAWTLPRSDLKS